MASAALDSSALFSTEHGTVHRASDDRLRVTLGDRDWTFDREELHTLHDALQPLAAQVYRCNCDCRWQLRMEGRSTIVLGTDEVLRLHSLLDGTAAMIELYELLGETSIARASSTQS
ncbi:MAG: citrate synthase [Salinibacter sp.]